MRLSSLSGQKVLVIGLGRTGLAAAGFLVSRGAEVLALDTYRSPELEKSAKRLADLGVEVELGATNLNRIPKVEFAIVSPGIPPHSPVFRAAVAKGVPMYSEVELASWAARGPIIGITGTNGKTTTVSLVGDIFKRAGKKVAIAGNIGYPLIDATTVADEGAYLVAELSSFQLECTDGFRPHVAALLNLTPDHLDWHGDLANYAQAKDKIFRNQTSSDWAVVNADADYALSSSMVAQRRSFSLEKPVAGAWLENGSIMADIDGPQAICPEDELAMMGRHNLANALAAATIALTQGISAQDIRESVTRFRGVEHRLEFVRNLDGVDYYNDSKATNPEAAVVGLRSFDRPIVLIAGGRSKGGALDSLAGEAANRCRSVVLLGEAASEMRAAFEAAGCACIIVDDIQQAVSAGRQLSQSGDIVLLSPACASHDMFSNFEERGRLFKECVNRER